MKILWKFQIPTTITKKVEIEKEIDGKKVTVLEDEIQTINKIYLIRKPTRADYDEAEFFYDKLFSENVRAGIITRSEVIKRFANEDVMIKKTYEDYVSKESELQRLNLQERTEENIVKKDKVQQELLNILVDIQNFEMNKSSVFDRTAENRSRSKTIIWWILHLAYKLDENNKELVRVQLEESLEAQGFNQHVANGFTINGKFFPHPSTDIASGFLSADQTPVNLFDKLIEITTKLQEFEEILKKVKGTINVKFVDEAGNEILIKKSQMNKFFAGYYADMVSDLSVKKGIIISKTFFLTIENIAATPLELISRLPGTNTLRIKSSENPSSTSILPTTYTYYSNYGTYDSTDTDYNNNKKYDLVPIVLANPDNPDTEIAVLPPYQSSQFKSQFIYARYWDIAIESTFYSYEYPDIFGEPSGSFINIAKDGEYIYNRITADTGTSPTDFVWGGTFNVSTGEALTTTDIEAVDDEAIEVHINHPFLTTPQAFAAAYENLTGITLTIPVSGTWNVINEAKQIFRQSKFAKITANTTLGKKQSIYLYDDGSQVGSDLPSPFKRTLKTSFDINDQFLVGKQSCGCYLFMASDIASNLAVDGKTATSIKEIKLGSENSIRIPIIFQFRMTDYYGQNDTGLGNIGGDSTGATTSLVYSKQMGFDIYDSNSNVFSFDIEVTAKYKSDNLNVDKLPGRTLQIAIDDVRRTIGGLSPSIVETKIQSQNQ